MALNKRRGLVKSGSGSKKKRNRRSSSEESASSHSSSSSRSLSTDSAVPQGARKDRNQRKSWREGDEDIRDSSLTPSRQEKWIKAGFDEDQLYTDANDKIKLNQMSEFDRERVLASRYEEILRKRQRTELFEHTATTNRHAERLKKKRDAFLDIRAKRHRQKQKQDAFSGDDDVDESDARRSRGSRTDHARTKTSPKSDDDDMEMSDSSGSHASPNRRTHAKTGSVGRRSSGSDDNLIVSRGDKTEKSKSAAQTTQPAGGVEERYGLTSEGTHGLFAEEEVDVDVMRSRYHRGKVLDSINLELLQSVRLSTDRILHMLDHPNAETYLIGCFVKLVHSSSTESIFYIVGVETSPSYRTSGKQCKHRLKLRPGTLKGQDRSEALTALSNKPITESEFQAWKNSIINEKLYKTSIQQWPKKIKLKAEQLKEFTFTEADVENILKQNNPSAEGGHNLVKQIHSVIYEIQALNQSIEEHGDGVEGGEEVLRSKKLADLQLKLQYLQAIDSRKSGSAAIGSKQRFGGNQSLGFQRGRPEWMSGDSPNPFSRRGRSSVSRQSVLDDAAASNSVSNRFGGQTTARPQSSFKEEEDAELGGHRYGVEANPFARRECRPTMMWDIGAENSPKRNDAESPNDAAKSQDLTPKSIDEAKHNKPGSRFTADTLLSSFIEQKKITMMIQKFYSKFKLSEFLPDVDFSRLPQRSCGGLGDGTTHIEGHIQTIRHLQVNWAESKDTNPEKV